MNLSFGHEPIAQADHGDGLASRQRPRPQTRRRRGRLDGLRAEPLPPIVRAPTRVGDRDDRDRVTADIVDDLIRKAWDQMTPYGKAGRTRHRRARVGMLLDHIEYRGDEIPELCTETGALLLMPSNRLGELRCSRLADSDRSRHRPRISLSMRRLTSSQGSSFSLPASIRSIRR